MSAKHERAVADAYLADLQRALSDVIRYLITDFGVEPLRPDRADVLRDI